MTESTKLERIKTARKVIADIGNELAEAKGRVKQIKDDLKQAEHELLAEIDGKNEMPLFADWKNESVEELDTDPSTLAKLVKAGIKTVGDCIDCRDTGDYPWANILSQARAEALDGAVQMFFEGKGIESPVGIDAV